MKKRVTGSTQALALLTIPLCVSLLTGTLRPVSAQTSAYSVSGWVSPNSIGGYSLGFKFKPTQDIYITALGEWDANGTTLSGPDTIGIFASSSLLLSVPFTRANATLSSNVLGDGSQFRYTDITGQLSDSVRKLSANVEYTLSGSYQNNHYASGGVNLSSSPLITLTSNGLYTLGGDPGRPTFDAGYNMYGTNFLFSTSPLGNAVTPEPGSLALLCGLASIGTGLLRRRRAKRT